jgi:parvulin-like peptidyl-prolyl isomerase
MQGKRSRRATALLVLGALAGLVLAAAGLAARSRPADAIPDDLVARVNGEPVRREDYDRLLAAMASDRREPVDDATRRHVLDRLIDEELLVQHALELGLVRSDRRVRADLTSAVISSVVSGREDRPPSDDELRKFYDRNRDFFAQPGRVRLRQIFFRAGGDTDEAALVRAGDVARRLRAGEPFEQLAALGDAPIAPLPDVPLPAAKLRDYLGPTVSQAALDLGDGAVGGPVRSANGYHVLQMLDRSAQAIPALQEIRNQVAAEYRRRGGEDALQAYLDDLRGRARIVRSERLQ